MGAGGGGEPGSELAGRARRTRGVRARGEGARSGVAILRGDWDSESGKRGDRDRDCRLEGALSGKDGEAAAFWLLFVEVVLMDRGGKGSVLVELEDERDGLGTMLVADARSWAVGWSDGMMRYY